MQLFIELDKEEEVVVNFAPMKEVYDQERARLEGIRERSGSKGHTQPPASGYDQANVEVATPMLTLSMKGVGQLTSDEAERLLELAREVGKEIGARFGIS